MKHPDVNKPNKMGQSLKDLAIEKLIVELNEDGFDKAGVNHHVRGFLLGVKWLLSLQPDQPEAGEETMEFWKEAAKKYLLLNIEKSKELRHVIYDQKKLESEISELKSRLQTQGGFSEDDMRESFGAGVDHQNLPWKYDNWEKFITEYKNTKQ